MGLFWKRKSSDQFVSLKLNEPLPKTTSAEQPNAPAKETAPTRAPEPPAAAESARPVIDAVPTGAGPTPIPVEPAISKPATVQPRPETSKVVETAPRPAVARSSFQTSVLGLNLSMEELQAQEAALEQEFSAR